MPDLARRERFRKQGWAAPGGAHDWLIRLLKIGLPVAIGVALAYLALVPLTKDRDLSFILDKDKVDVAKERMRVQAARYEGLDDRGRAFTINAQSAVQANSREPVVDVTGMNARILLEGGPASLRAPKGRYNLDSEKIDVIGPILFTAADGYQLQTRDVEVDLNTRTMSSNGRVEGQMPLGRFSADRMAVDLPEREVTLTGRARLHIVQGGIR